MTALFRSAAAVALFVLALHAPTLSGADKRPMKVDDLFAFKRAGAPQISPDGTRVVFVRNFNDIMKDKKRSNLWIADFEGHDLRPLTTGNENDFSPRWSSDFLLFCLHAVRCLLASLPAKVRLFWAR